MGESSWNCNTYSRMFADDYRYIFEDDFVKTKNEVLEAIMKIKQENALQTFYKNLDVNEKKELMELILNDPNLL